MEYQNDEQFHQNQVVFDGGNQGNGGNNYGGENVGGDGLQDDYNNNNSVNNSGISYKRNKKDKKNTNL